MAKPRDKFPSGVLQPMASSWCHWSCEVVKTDFEWTIHQFELRNSRVCYPETASFSASDTEVADLSWALSLTGKGIMIAHGFNVPGLQQIQFNGKCTRNFRVKTSFLNTKRAKVFWKEALVTEGMNMPLIVNSTQRESVMEKANDLLSKGNLTIYCEIETYKDEKKLKGRTVTNVLDQPFSNKDELVTDFEELFQNKTSSDVTFHVRGREIGAHKSILVARSPVFAAMFQHPTKENLSGVVEIPDIEPEVFQEFLRYIYTGQVPLKRMDEVAAELLAAADKYLMKKLKKECEDHLIKRMTPDSCIKVLAMDDAEQTSNLKKTAEDFARRYPVKVMATDTWKKASKDKPDWMWNVQQLLLDKFALQYEK